MSLKNSSCHVWIILLMMKGIVQHTTQICMYFYGLFPGTDTFMFLQIDVFFQYTARQLHWRRENGECAVELILKQFSKFHRLGTTSRHTKTLTMCIILGMYL